MREGWILFRRLIRDVAGRWLIAGAVWLAAVTQGMPVAAETLQFRISLENTADHVQTLAVQAFAEELRSASGGRIQPQVFHSGALFRDADVIAALNRGHVEMAVPGTWHIDRFQPDIAVFLLPRFFGREISFQHAHADGALGREVSRRLEDALGVVVPGRWFDLGHGHLFFRGRAVESHEALAGLTIRVAGGIANELRVQALGAEAITVAWGEVPTRLSRGQMDGLLTTYETVRSGRLWEFGITHVLEDYQYMPQYVPMIRRSFWDALSLADRELIRETWEAQVDRQRAAAARAQREARQILRREGIRIAPVDAAALEHTRTRLMARQPEFADRLGIDPVILELLHEGP